MDPSTPQSSHRPPARSMTLKIVEATFGASFLPTIARRRTGGHGFAAFRVVGEVDLEYKLASSWVVEPFASPCRPRVALGQRIKIDRARATAKESASRTTCPRSAALDRSPDSMSA